VVDVVGSPNKYSDVPTRSCSNIKNIEVESLLSVVPHRTENPVTVFVVLKTRFPLDNSPPVKDTEPPAIKLSVVSSQHLPPQRRPVPTEYELKLMFPEATREP